MPSYVKVCVQIAQFQNSLKTMNLGEISSPNSVYNLFMCKIIMIIVQRCIHFKIFFIKEKELTITKYE